MLQDWIQAIEGWIPTLAESAWVFPALTAFAMIDGFFPPIPSESVVIALASLSVSHGSPNIVLIALAGALGAFIGDQIAYAIGSRVDVHRLRIFRTDRGRKALAWAEHALEHRGSSFILAARYIPVGRVAVNMSAGALGYPRGRFVGLTALAAVTWAAYGSIVGAGAGLWLADHPVIAVVAGVVVGTLVGVGIDWVLRRWTGLGRRAAVVGSGTAGPADAVGGTGPEGAGADTVARAADPVEDTVARPDVSGEASAVSAADGRRSGSGTAQQGSPRVGSPCLAPPAGVGCDCAE